MTNSHDNKPIDENIFLADFYEHMLDLFCFFVLKTIFKKKNAFVSDIENNKFVFHTCADEQEAVAPKQRNVFHLLKKTHFPSTLSLTCCSELEN